MRRGRNCHGPLFDGPNKLLIAAVEDFTGAAHGALADVEKRCGLRVSFNRPNGRLIRASIPSVRERRQSRPDHRSLRCVQMSAVKVRRHDDLN